MSRSSIPDEIRRLIAEMLPSVERLEVLLLLYEGRQRGWTIEELQAQIRSTPESIRQNSSALVAASLAVVEGTMPAAIRYQPATERLNAAVQALAEIYRTRRVTVVETIYAERATDAQSFSDAFQIRKPHDR